MYEITLIYDDYGWVDNECKKINLKKKGQCTTWAEVETFLACYFEVFGKINCEVKILEVAE